MDTLEVVYGNSFYRMLQENQSCNNDILLFNVLLNIGDLSNVKNYKSKLHQELERDEYESFEEEMLVIKNAVMDGKKIRIWTSHQDIYSYLILLYLCNFLKDYESELYVIYVDEYDKDCVVPACMKDDEIGDVINLEHKLNKKDILEFSNMWEVLISENADMRILENGKVKSVSIGYYDEMILDRLKELGNVKVVRLVGSLMGSVNFIDSLYIYMIKKLIEKGKIKVISEEDSFSSYIIGV